DVEYYIQKQILPPVSRILGVFGVDIATLDHDSKQKGLFDFTQSPDSDKKIHNRDMTPIREETISSTDDEKTQSSLFDF
ncbi:MAG: hypothetical protein K8R64_09055, partial [Methanosarcinaceae archaeon]|nr:hypothetical protein [Methanosarcinaceae archaeon]